MLKRKEVVNKGTESLKGAEKASKIVPGEHFTEKRFRNRVNERSMTVYYKEMVGDDYGVVGFTAVGYSVHALLCCVLVR